MNDMEGYLLHEGDGVVVAKTKGTNTTLVRGFVVKETLGYCKVEICDPGRHFGYGEPLKVGDIITVNVPHRLYAWWRTYGDKR